MSNSVRTKFTLGFGLICIVLLYFFAGGYANVKKGVVDTGPYNSYSLPTREEKCITDNDFKLCETIYHYNVENKDYICNKTGKIKNKSNVIVSYDYDNPLSCMVMDKVTYDEKVPQKYYTVMIFFVLVGSILFVLSIMESNKEKKNSD